MATPYEQIYSSFYQKVKSYSLSNLSETDANSILQGYLKSGVTRFQYYCVQDLTQQDDTLLQFNVDLAMDEIEILARCMIYEYLDAKVYTDELLKQGFTNKEWSRTSQANHLDEMLKLRETTDKEIDRMIMRYAYSRANFGAMQ